MTTAFVKSPSSVRKQNL